MQGFARNTLNSALPNEVLMCGEVIPQCLCSNSEGLVECCILPSFDEDVAESNHLRDVFKLGLKFWGDRSTKQAVYLISRQYQ